ncbi:hypothetical protein BC826DRAFT_1184404 [Russula brevipes]|nr:hypothetical protein BC826DRAFT_1184404 [Russula brevipes]
MASSTSMELRRLGLETLHQILQASGHTLVAVVGWEARIGSGASAGPLLPTTLGLAPSSPGAPRSRLPPLGYLRREKGYSTLIEIAFQCMTLMCDALAAAPSARATGGYELPEVYMGAIQTLFGTLQLYGATLSLETWDECVWKVVLDTLPPHVRRNALTPPSSPDAAGTTVFDADMPTQDPSSSWDDSKVAALQSIGAIPSDFLASKIIHLPSFGAAWETAATAVAQAHAMASDAEAATLRPSLVEMWERTWVKCEEMGAAVVRRVNAAAQQVHTPAPFTQESLLSL